MQWEQVCICELDNISRQWSNRLKHIWYTYDIESTIAVASSSSSSRYSTFLLPLQNIRVICNTAIACIFQQTKNNNNEK